MKKIMLLAIIIYGMTNYVNAVPVDPTPKVVRQPNGTSLTIRTVGDEYFLYTITVDDFVIECNNEGNYEYVDMKDD